MKRLLATATLIAFFISIIPNSYAAVTAGSTCKKLGATSTYAGKKYTCIKSGKKLVWNKGVAVSTPTLKPTPSATPKSTASVMHEIEVKGIQWTWQFIYRKAGAKAIVTGTPTQPPTLVVPQGESVRYVLTSNDVAHGFWIPALRIQMQNLPGVTNYLEFTANKLGTFPGLCNIFCGRDHARMLFNVKVVTPADYKIFLETLKASNA